MTENCSMCGRARDAQADPADALAWACDNDRGQQRLICPQCTRLHTKDIEGKLPAEYW